MSRVEQLSENVALYFGDCLEVMASLDKVDAIVTDPPYAIPTQVASGRTITRNVGDLSIVEGAFREHAAAWKRLVGESGRILVFCDGASYPVIYRSAYSHFNLASLVWDKKQIGMGREFRKRHELVVHGWGASTPVTAADGTGYPDVLEFKPVPSQARHHPAEKPIDLIEGLIRVCGRTVLDPFMGSGSTGVAAVNKGRGFVGIEIHEPYFDIACKRISEALRRAGKAKVGSVDYSGTLFQGLEAAE